MSNYVETTNFTALTTVHAVINGAAFDLEYGNIATAIATKFDNLNTGYAGPFLMTSGNTSITLTVQGPQNQYASAVIGNATSGQSYGMLISAGTTSADQSFYVRNQSGSTNYFVIQGDGGVRVGNPSPADEGLGTINVSGGYFVNGVALSQPVVGNKTTIQTVTSSTTLVNDTAITVPLGVGKWAIDGYLDIFGGAGGFKFTFNNTATVTSGHINAAGDLGSGAVSAAGTTYTYYPIAEQNTYTSTTLRGGGVDNSLILSGNFVVTVAGTLTLQWAQNSSSATGTSIEPGSYIKLTKIG